jgi:hypothetical protein
MPAPASRHAAARTALQIEYEPDLERQVRALLVVLGACAEHTETVDANLASTVAGEAAPARPDSR